MKHIDMKLSWVDQVRDLKRIEYSHVDGTLNDADAYTKIKQGASFEKEQARVMTPLDEVQ